MIDESKLAEIGKINKPHGIKGELSVELDDGLEPDDFTCFFVELNGLFVPFFVAESRPRGKESWLMRFIGVENEKDAAMFANKPLFVKDDEVDFEDGDSDGFYLSDLIGFQAFADEQLLGTITDYDDSTQNILFQIDNDGRQLYIPATEDFIEAIDTQDKSVIFTLPDGLINL